MQQSQFPRKLVSFSGMPGTYGRLEVTALTPTTVEFKMIGEFLHWNRADATELVRVMNDWLAATPVETHVVRTHGDTSHVVVVDNGPGQPRMTVHDDDPRREPLPNEAPHFERLNPPR